MKTIILNETEASTLRDVLERLNISADPAPGHPELPLAPEGLPPFPPVPEGYDAWAYRGTGWKAEKAVYAFIKNAHENWHTTVTPNRANGLPDTYYLEAVKRPVQPPVMPDNLPTLPEGTVYLGLGNPYSPFTGAEFKVAEARPDCWERYDFAGWLGNGLGEHYATEIDSLLHKAQPWYQPQEPEPVTSEETPMEGDLEKDFLEELRDRFAMSALTTLNFTNKNNNTKQLAEYAYEVADAMLKARKRS